MNKLLEKIKKIPKTYFSLNEISKLSHLNNASLKVTLHRLIKNKQLFKIGQKLYSLEPEKIDWRELACEIYYPSYLSFEWALAYHNILSQKPLHLTLATSKRTKEVNMLNKNIFYHHLNPNLFWGYQKQDNILLAEPEKAFLDLVYLSLNGYAKFDPEEINLKALNKTKLKKYLQKFNNQRLNKLLGKYI